MQMWLERVHILAYQLEAQHYRKQYVIVPQIAKQVYDNIESVSGLDVVFSRVFQGCFTESFGAELWVNLSLREMFITTG